jgi:hypothetical protein
MVKSTAYSELQNEIADPILYRTYFGLLLEDVLHKLGYDATPQNKKILHDFHKRVLGYDTIAGRTHEVVSRFIFECSVLWCERGIFARTSGKQEWGIEERPLSEIWDQL